MSRFGVVNSAGENLQFTPTPRLIPMTTHTHTHTEGEREREQEGEGEGERGRLGREYLMLRFQDLATSRDERRIKLVDF